MEASEMSVEKQIKPWKINDWMRNKCKAKILSCAKSNGKGNLLVYSLGYSKPNSNINNILVSRLRTTSLLHANTILTLKVYCSITNHWHNLKKPSKIRNIFRKKTINNIIDFLFGIINSDKLFIE